MSSSFEYSNQLGSTPAQQASSSYGSASDWAQILSAIGQGASKFPTSLPSVGGKKEAKEAKRRTRSNLLNQALKREQGLS